MSEPTIPYKSNLLSNPEPTSKNVSNKLLNCSENSITCDSFPFSGDI